MYLARLLDCNEARNPAGGCGAAKKRPQGVTILYLFSPFQQTSIASHLTYKCTVEGGGEGGEGRGGRGSWQWEMLGREGSWKMGKLEVKESWK